MPNIAKAFKDEIIRLSRKEAKAAIAPVRKPSIAARKALACLKKRVSALEKATKSLSAILSNIPVQKPVVEEGKNVRITGKGMRSLRKRLRLTQTAFARLVGVSGQNAYQWERKNGPLRVRDATKAAILAIRNLTATEARARLAQMPAKKAKPAAKRRRRKGRKA